MPQAMNEDVSRAVDYILTGGLAADKANQTATTTSFAPKNMLNTVKQIYTRSKSPMKNRKSSPAAQVVNVSEDDYEDEDMRLAMEMSLQDSGVSSSRGRSPNLAPSNGGVPISVEESPYFGPAREIDYHESSWGMTVSGSSGQETGVIDNQGKSWVIHTPNYNSEPDDLKLDPEERKRGGGQPAVLDTRGMSGGWITDSVTLLAGLMTILHNIPKAREMFLLAAPRDPGTEDEPGEKWWRGSQPLTNAAVSDEEVDITGEIVLREAARIMSFLDDTIRSYGRRFLY